MIQEYHSLSAIFNPHLRLLYPLPDGLLPTSQQQRAILGWSWTNCGSPTDAIRIESISVSPDPPILGHPLTATVKASVQEQIEEGAYGDVSVNLGLIELSQTNFDFCDEVHNLNTTIQCPVQPGGYVVQHTVILPNEVLPDGLNINAQGYTVNDDSLFCVDFEVNL